MRQQMSEQVGCSRVMIPLSKPKINYYRSLMQLQHMHLRVYKHDSTPAPCLGGVRQWFDTSSDLSGRFD